MFLELLYSQSSVLSVTNKPISALLLPVTRKAPYLNSDYNILAALYDFNDFRAVFRKTSTIQQKRSTNIARHFHATECPPVVAEVILNGWVRHLQQILSTLTTDHHKPNTL